MRCSLRSYKGITYIVAVSSSVGFQSSKEISSLGVHVAVDGEKLAAQKMGEELTQCCLSTPAHANRIVIPHTLHD